ncbi:MAG TPA: hypothetical protein VK602_13755 [Phyllobacterium sp.]|nr:hypothetical protein [Phyllobacterium sp.]
MKVTIEVDDEEIAPLFRLSFNLKEVSAMSQTAYELVAPNLKSLNSVIRKAQTAKRKRDGREPSPLPGSKELKEVLTIMQALVKSGKMTQYEYEVAEHAAQL